MAQETIQPKQLEDPSKGIVYNQEFAINFRMHTRGLGFGVNMGKLQTYYRTKYWHFELGELQHCQEYKQRQDTPSSFNGRVSKAFKYGKQNNLFVARVGLGAKRYFSEKAKHKGVAVGISYEAGTRWAYSSHITWSFLTVQQQSNLFCQVHRRYG